ncbi:rubredoxin [Streptomyces fuscichromogenes]|uniref:rubredoxin n=1 Tax=Streptomyces fuscichromogenes TaxID=1324013 RepID=UPI0037F84E7D
MSTQAKTAQKWYCEPCGYTYDPAEGDPEGGVPPGTAFEDIPASWFCPVCGANKQCFAALRS